VVNGTFSNISFISWRSVVLLEETEVAGETVLLIMSSVKIQHNKCRFDLWCVTPLSSLCQLYRGCQFY
jgi:hypothetical protein